MGRTKKGVVVSQFNKRFGIGIQAGDEDVDDRITVEISLEGKYPLKFELPVEEAPEWYVGRAVTLEVSPDELDESRDAD